MKKTITASAVNWDPVLYILRCQISKSVKKKGIFWHMRYPLADGSGELLSPLPSRDQLGDTAVAVQLEDDAIKINGKQIKLPHGSLDPLLLTIIVLTQSSVPAVL